MDLLNLEPGCYEADGYIVPNVHNINDSYYYPHDYDTIKIDENYKIHSLEYPYLTGSVERDISGNVYLHFEDPFHQENIYYEKSFDDEALLFSAKNEDGDLSCLKMKKSECKA